MTGASRVERIGDATLYLGRCEDILPTLGKVDAVVTDPPYGVSGQQNTKTAKSGGGRKNDYVGFIDSRDYVQAVAVPIVEYFVSIGSRVVVTPGNACLTLYPAPAAFGAFYQPASVGLQAWGRADAQPILYYGRSPFAGTGLPGQRCSYMLTEAPEPNGHPCPKPLGAWSRLVAAASRAGEMVCDPFMGSGTTGVACANLGRFFIGIEREPTYFDIACRRIEEAYRQPRLFDEPMPKPVQDKLFGDAA